MNGLLYNYCKTPDAAGCVGRSGTLAKMITGTHIVRFSVEDDVLIRDAQGRCIECQPGEVGQLIIEIRNTAMSNFRV
jgi:fatty-acyl-CoA synthase